MPKYDDDQCERCGGVRVAESTLCGDCLVKRLDAEKKEMLIKHVVIEMLRKKLQIQTELLDDALSYGFRRNRENTSMLKYIKDLELKIREVMEDGKNRI